MSRASIESMNEEALTMSFESGCPNSVGVFLEEYGVEVHRPVRIPSAALRDLLKLGSLTVEDGLGTVSLRVRGSTIEGRYEREGECRYNANFVLADYRAMLASVS